MLYSLRSQTPFYGSIGCANQRVHKGEYSMELEINYLAVALAALSAFFLCFIWYTVLFARPWQRLIGMGVKDNTAAGVGETPNLGRLLAASLALEVVMAF